MKTQTFLSIFLWLLIGILMISCDPGIEEKELVPWIRLKAKHGMADLYSYMYQ